MKIIMNTTAAGPMGTYMLGQQLEVGTEISPAQAKAFVAGGYAREVKAASPVKPAAVETASLEPVAEAAVSPAAERPSRTGRTPARRTSRK